MSLIQKSLLVFLFTPFLLLGCGKSSGDTDKSNKDFFGNDSNPINSVSAFDLVVADGRFQTFREGLVETNLDRTLDRSGPFTVFAPTDSAFNRLPLHTRRILENNRSILRQVLMHHILEFQLSETELKFQILFRTMQNENIRVRLINGNTFVSNARVTQVNGFVGNGVVHVVDEVIVPPSLRNTLGL